MSLLQHTGTTGSAADYFPVFKNRNVPSLEAVRISVFPSLVDSGGFYLHSHTRPVINQVGNGKCLFVQIKKQFEIRSQVQITLVKNQIDRSLPKFQAGVDDNDKSE